MAGAPIHVGNGPVGIAITPDGSKAYVANQFDNTVSVIATATNTVVTTIGVGSSPIAFGIFILPPKTVSRVTDSPPPANRRQHR